MVIACVPRHGKLQTSRLAPVQDMLELGTEPGGAREAPWWVPQPRRPRGQARTGASCAPRMPAAPVDLESRIWAADKCPGLVRPCSACGASSAAPWCMSRWTGKASGSGIWREAPARPEAGSGPVMGRRGGWQWQRVQRWQ